jgi:hypothetical protein
MKTRILDGSVVSSYVHRLHGIPLMFVHAGFRPAYVHHLERGGVNVAEAEAVSEHTNLLLREAVENCGFSNYNCELDETVFSAGPDRGGRGEQQYLSAHLR